MTSACALAFKNNASFISCISKINKLLPENSEGLDIVMRMYSLTECSENYSKTSEIVQDHYRDEPNSGTEGNINYSINDSKSFDYKTGIKGELINKNI